MEHIVETKSLRLWSSTKDRAEYERLRRVIGTDLKQTLESSSIRSALLSNSVAALTAPGDLIVLHDPCDIRKAHSKELEDLGKVRDLNGKIINGYSSFNSVVVDVHGLTLKLLDTEIYSNRSREYVKESEIELQEKKGTIEGLNESEKARFDEVKRRLEKDDYINFSKITKQQLKKTSEALHKTGVRILTHVLDRQFDNGEVFDEIDKVLKDKFVIRLKTSRTVESAPAEEGIKQKKIKLNQYLFANKGNQHHPKLSIKGKVYQDVCCEIFWENGVLSGYAVLKIQLLDRNGKGLFKQPLLLSTNHKIDTFEEALAVYRMYLKRSKIEGVFKFLKDVLGWEEFQIRDFDSIKNLLAFVYFIAGYFYEIESALIQDDYIRFLCELGGGKGKVTRFYLLEGLSKLVNKQTVDNWIEKNNITPEQLIEMLKLLRMS